MTPTRRVNFDSLGKSTFRDKEVIDDAYRFLNQIKNSYGNYSEKILVGGLLGCKGDAYSGKKTMSVHESYSFHKKHTIRYRHLDFDYLFAGIMPEINEAIGLAKAMAETNLPYIISFMIRKDGYLLDGTFLTDAIRLIDEEVTPGPVFYMTNCIHPTNLKKALMVKQNLNNPLLKRFWGLQANTSALSPEELNGCSMLHQDNFEDIINEMVFLKSKFNLKVFGGCCGTNDAFMDELSQKLTCFGNNS